MRLPELIDEIKTLRRFPSHKSTMDICRMLENNRKKFLEKMDSGDFNMVLSNFENLSNSKPTEYDSESYVRAYEQAHSIMSFYLDRIL